MVTAQTPVFDKQEQLDKIMDVILPDEAILAVYDLKGAQTGFIGITDRRLIIYDKSFLGKKKAMVSVAYKSIIALGSEDEGSFLKLPGFVSSKLAVQTAGGNFDMEFRGQEKAHEAYRLIIARIL